MSSQGVYLSHDATRKQLREDLLDVITDMSPKETPLFKELPKGTATGVFHEFNTYSVARATGIDASVEGADVTFAALGSPTRNINFVQEITQPYKVSYIQEAANNAGGNELARRRKEAMEIWKLKLEYSLIYGSGNSGASNTARVMKGILNVISTNSTNTSGGSLTETNFNNYLQLLWNNVNSEDSTFNAYFDMRLKRVVSGFTSGITKNVDAEDKRLINSIDVYESDVAKMVRLFPHRDLSGTNQFFAILPAAFQIDMYTNPKDMPVPETGNWKGGKVYGAGTLAHLYEKAGLRVTNLA